MFKISTLIAVVIVFSILSLPVLSQEDDGMMKGGRANNNVNMNEKAKEMHDKGEEIRNAQGMMGMGFVHRDNDRFGNFVTFTVNNMTGEVLNYSITGEAVFDSIKFSNLNLNIITTDGTITRISNKNNSAVIQLHDNPTAVINIHTEVSSSLILTMSQGVTASKEENIIRVDAGNITAYIASVNVSSVIIEGDMIKIDSANGNVIFRAMPVNMPIDREEGLFMGEMMRNRAGAEISAGESNKVSIVNYTNDMKVRMISSDQNRLRMMVGSENHTGKILMMNIDNSSLKFREGQRIGLLLDNKTMKQVMSEQELYDANESSFWLKTNGDNRMMALIYIANFSDHEVDIVVEEGTPTPGMPEATPASEVTAPAVSATPGTPGFGIMVGLLCTAVAYRLRRNFDR